MKKIASLGIVALVLAACAGDPVWNESAFPQQPQYGGAPAAPTVADAKK